MGTKGRMYTVSRQQIDGNERWDRMGGGGATEQECEEGKGRRDRGTEGRRDRGTEGPRDGGTEGNNLQVNVLDAAIQKDGLVVAPLVKTYLHIFHYIYAVSRC